ncbi:PG_1841 family phosphatidylglycerol lysyltransferase-like protein [Porphyromonas loveana]|uniref:PG_1841 family phosphatidylglycerol lysyltransferase-like protein n=1 Tax=Porphyromonas loveana TaxID=1884669 RepID=UPI00359F4038
MNIDFKPVQPSDREAITAITFSAGAQICDLAFSNLYCWSYLYGTSWAVVEDCLIVRFRPKTRNHPVYLFPVGAEPDKVVAAAYRLKDQVLPEEYPLVFMGVTPDVRACIEEHCTAEYHFIEDEAYCDYIYERESLASLSGKKLQAKRNHINKFLSLYPDYSYAPMEQSDVEECLSLTHLWLDSRGDEDGRDSEVAMVERAFRHREELGLTGGVLRVEGRVVAFCLGSPINATTYGVHIEKADASVEGAFTMINREYARSIPESYRYVNREEDLGLPGLRQAKLSYRPAIILPKQTAILRRDHVSDQA